MAAKEWNGIEITLEVTFPLNGASMQNIDRVHEELLGSNDKFESGIRRAFWDALPVELCSAVLAGHPKVNVPYVGGGTDERQTSWTDLRNFRVRWKSCVDMRRKSNRRDVANRNHQCRVGGDSSYVGGEMSKPVDMVNHPPHYTMGKYEVIDVIEDWSLDYHEGNTVKYVARAKHKGSELENLQKARWYLDRKIQKLEKAEQQ